MSRYYDSLETRDPQEREKALMTALAAQIEHARKNTKHYGEVLKGVAGQDITSRAALARLPITRKSSLSAAQKAAPPLGGFLAVPTAELAHVFMSPGPIFEVDSPTPDFWRGARTLYAHGLRRGDIVHNTFSYHMVPAGLLFETGARAIGCPVFPAGTGNTELQLDAIEAIRPAAYAGTPSFLKILLEKAREMGRDVSSIRKASVGAEAYPPPLRQLFHDAGIAAYQSYGTADLGIIAYETEAVEGMVIDEGLIVEIVRPGSGDPVPDGEVGEVVVTNLNPVYPLIRFGTGDMSAIMAGTSPCGRTNSRIKGWMGRADQRTKVKGMFVDPEQVIQIGKRHPELVRLRLVVDWVNQADVMTLKAEIAGQGSADLTRAVEATIQSVCKVRGSVSFVAQGSLPNDGKVIDDVRKYD